MCPSLLGDARLYAMLLRCDEDLASGARAAGCECGGVLHSARYGRTPRGATVALPEGYDRRDSFCCAEEGYLANAVEHPAVVRVLDDGVTEDGALFLVMDLLSGEPLEARWERHGRRLGVPETVSLTLELLDVLVPACSTTAGASSSTKPSVQTYSDGSSSARPSTRTRAPDASSRSAATRGRSRVRHSPTCGGSITVHGAVAGTGR